MAMISIEQERDDENELDRDDASVVTLWDAVCGSW